MSCLAATSFKSGDISLLCRRPSKLWLPGACTLTLVQLVSKKETRSFAFCIHPAPSDCSVFPRYKNPKECQSHYLPIQHIIWSKLIQRFQVGVPWHRRLEGRRPLQRASCFFWNSHVGCGKIHEHPWASMKKSWRTADFHGSKPT